MKNARTVRTLSRTGIDLGFAYLPTGKGVRRIAKLIRAHNRLTSGLTSEAVRYHTREGLTLRAQIKEMTAFAKSEFCSAP